MGRTYNLSPDSNGDEKAIGGILTFKQFFWLLAGFVIGLVLFAIMFLITGNITSSIFAILVGVALMCPFAFIRKYDMTLFTYLKYKGKFKKKNKKLINSRGE